MKLSEQVKPISYLKAHTSEVIRNVSRDRRAVIITQNGEAKAIVQDLDSYEKMKESLALLKIIAQGKKEIEAGEYEPLSKAFKSIRNKIKVRSGI
jgi:prevent-host-death family protein